MSGFNRSILYGMVLVFITSFTDSKESYVLYTKKGKKADYSDVLKAIDKADIVFFGELHNNPICHWLELELAKDVYAKEKNITLAMEMFEADDQLVLNEYLSGLIEEKQFLKEAKIWENYKTDYRPLVEFAKTNKLPVIASNIPRRYANLVYKKGITALDSLPDESKRFIAPLPIAIDLELPGYKSMIQEMGAHNGRNAENIAKSQAVKDATMAYFILKNRKGIVLHYNGGYHSKNYEGIIWHLKKADSTLKIVTIHSVEQADISRLDSVNTNTADFIICIPEDMTKTY